MQNVFLVVFFWSVEFTLMSWFIVRPLIGTYCRRPDEVMKPVHTLRAKDFSLR